MCMIGKKLKEARARRATLKLDDQALDFKVRIQGTDFDRKRKVTAVMAQQMKILLKTGFSIESVAEAFGVSKNTVRYNTDEDYRNYILETNSGKHTGVQTKGFNDRVAYKRKLIADKKIPVYDI